MQFGKKMKAPANGYLANSGEGERKAINSELWHACAGPLVSLPPVGSLVVYFPQGHSEQVAASMQKESDSIPSYPNLPSRLICLLHNVTLHADPETDEVYAQMTLQPVNKYDQEALLLSELGLKQSRQPADFFCKTLTASDTSTHGGFSVPRRAAEKIFPPLDFSMQPPAQELGARDVHDQAWTFRHVYRGQPKRHLLTTGWSVFVSSKRLVAGDSVLFIRDEKSQLLLGIKHANRQQPALSSSVISSDSMHIGILAAAAHAAANNSPFTIFYNPRASPSEFVIPFAKYNKAMYTQVSLGMRFRMMFETEESSVRRYMGTITGIADLDLVRWKSSQWRNLQVGWDESTAGERPGRVSVWEIDPVVTPFYMCPPPFFRPRFPKHPGFPDDESDMDNVFKRGMPWLGHDLSLKDSTSSVLPGLSLVQWMNMQQNNQLPAAQSRIFPSALHGNLNIEDHSKLLNFQSPGFSATNLQFGKVNQLNQQANQLQQTSLAAPQPQQLQQLLHSSVNSQQQQHPQQQQQQQQNTLLRQQPQQPLHQQQCPPQQQHIVQLASVNNGHSVTTGQIPNQHLQQPALYPQLQQQQLLTGNTQSASANESSFPLTSLAQDLQFQQLEHQTSLLKSQQQQAQLQQAPAQLLQQSLMQRPQVQQTSQQSFSEQHLQLQILQKLQQQQQQMLSPLSNHLEPHLPLHQQSLQQNRQFQQAPVAQQQPSGNSFSTSTLLQSPQYPINQLQGQIKSPVVIKAHSGPTDGDAPSCSTSPSANNCQVSSTKFLNRNQQGPVTRAGESVLDPSPILVHELHSRSDVRVKHELSSSKGAEQPKFRSNTDHLDASSSATSYCLDTVGLQQNFQLPGLCLDSDVQSHSRGTLPFTSTVDSLAPDALLSRDYDSGKEIQNMLSNYGGPSRDIDTELSAAAGFGVPNISFKPSCSNDVPITEAGVLNGSLWPNQTQRMRTYTKVQKRGSVGRTIDVTRYRGYDELRHDLARMFGIEGPLEDPQRTDWKLVYVDHENDILLVGDDPWEEFVSCVQSIKILSSAEVQQMSLDGDLGNLPVPNQACSGTDSGNAWRGHYDDNSAASFNR
ncbi:hypothetical protein ACH5RR_006251 [Cinchona calisaya]|uniref:Auxin response factor n=1 Tax=Cinchona calisaya TaxID=153742 RepID=A0ABD3ANF4_9GENT